MTNKQYPEAQSFLEYATPVYRAWDREGRTPPDGYKSWMEYGLSKNREIKRELVKFNKRDSD